ncbi:MAG: hypothetical protein NZZ60_05545 [Bacteroidia bacterium]|nr:hypothetical protein [Bacteroidia bacterium]MCX7652308.1 hypothetical protein [Bacteroidia bacterium]MDW8416570.1 hypothetical protein [Bacteroidia bacterium]
MKFLHLYFLLNEPVDGAVAMPLPPEVMRQTIEASLWSSEEKDKLRQHAAYIEQRFPVIADPISAFLEIYQEALKTPQILGIANPIAHTAHHIRWVEKIFSEGLEKVARETPPLHLWTGLVPVEVEVSLAELLRERRTALWVRTAGYEQFSLPNLAHPIADLREVGWVHSLFELLFDWMYFEQRPLRPGDAIEVPERGRYTIEDFMPGTLALIEWRETNGAV